MTARVGAQERGVSVNNVNGPCYFLSNLDPEAAIGYIAAVNRIIQGHMEPRFNHEYGHCVCARTEEVLGSAYGDGIRCLRLSIIQHSLTTSHLCQSMDSAPHSSHAPRRDLWTVVSKSS